VIITAGPLAILAVTPPMAVLTPGAATTFATSGEDIFGNAVVVVPVWSVIGNSGTIDTSTGLFTAGTKAGAWVGAVRASTSGQSATADVTVIPGPLAEIEVTPDSPVVTVKGQIQFQAAGTDAYGNAVSVPQDSYWSVTKGGGSFLASSGLFTAGCLPGTYEGTIQVATGSTKGLATVVVIAGTVTDLAVTPREAAVPVNEQITFQAAGADICGNAIEVAPTWTVVAGGGSVTSWGRFTAGRVAGRFQDTVQVALDGLQAYATVTVTAGPLSVISVKPASATLKPGNRRTFRAEGADAEGNAVEIVPVWSVAHGGGSIDGVGVFSAGDEEGVFAETVQATAAGTVVGTASVEVVMHAIPCGDDTDCPDDSSCDALKTCTDPVIEPGDQTPDSDDVGSIADSDGVGETTGADEGSVEPTADGVQGETASETGPSSETNGDLWDSGNRNDVVMEGGKSGGCNAHSANSGSDWMSFALSILAVGLLRKRRSKPVKTD
jgi:hypothetical protein